LDLEESGQGIMEAAQSEVLEFGAWVVRQNKPASEARAPVFVLLHGWTGDENAMWVFTSNLPKDAWILAPRGLYPADSEGFSWQLLQDQAFPKIDAFHPAVEALAGLLTAANFPQADWSQMRLVGFSQGAALAYAFALYHPERVQALAGLAGFMPEGAAALASARPLQGKKAFLAHGIQDELVPVERARQAARTLEQAGAQVTYCEDDVGHKLSAACFRGLQAFFRNESK
jgi:phospholipase/carboxylesterase